MRSGYYCRQFPRDDFIVNQLGKGYKMNALFQGCFDFGITPGKRIANHDSIHRRQVGSIVRGVYFDSLRSQEIAHGRINPLI